MGKWKKHSPLKIVMAPAQETFIRANWQAMNSQQLADALGLTRTITRQFCYGMGLYKMKLEYWTDEQEQYLRDNYQHIGDVELAEIFNIVHPKIKRWTKCHIDKKRSYLNLVRTPEEVKSIRERNKKQGRYSINHYKRWLGRITQAGERRAWCMSNGRYIMVIKLKQGFVHYAPWLYKQIYGPVPDGYVVRFKDGDPLNVVPGNLKLATRGEVAAENSKHRYPQELRETIQLLNKLKKTIYDIKHRKEATGDAQ